MVLERCTFGKPGQSVQALCICARVQWQQRIAPRPQEVVCILCLQLLSVVRVHMGSFWYVFVRAAQGRHWLGHAPSVRFL